jgi:hypothetical protein
MATEQLKAALKIIQERAEKLSLKSQNLIAKKILREIEDAEWEETLTSPESLADSEKELAEIERDIATGNIKNYISGDRLEELF